MFLYKSIQEPSCLPGLEPPQEWIVVVEWLCFQNKSMDASNFEVYADMLDPGTVKEESKRTGVRALRRPLQSGRDTLISFPCFHE